MQIPELIHKAHAEAKHHEDREIKVGDIESLKAFVPSTHPFFAIYFTMTFLHGLHVLGGGLVLGYFTFFSTRFWKSNPEQFTNRIEIGGLFWHFVDLVWIFLFPVMYLL
jgi:heme/copper-type cytochrome/quinol oxidase subunit 3